MTWTRLFKSGLPKQRNAGSTHCTNSYRYGYIAWWYELSKMLSMLR